MLFKLQELIRKTDNLSLPHKGIVVGNKDPKKLNRVRCIIKGIFETDTYANLPWIHPVLSSSSPSATSTSPPELNTELWVEFPQGKDSLYQPIYRGYWYSKKNGISHADNSSQSIFGADYPNLYGSQDSTGNYYLVNKLRETFDLEHSSGDHIKVSKNGDVLITGKHNITIDNSNKIEITSANSDINITATVGAINIIATSKVLVKSVGGVEVIGSLVKLAPDSTVATSLVPVVNGVITGLSPCILAGIPHALGSSTVLAPP